jgi:hypothetical protein
MDYLVSNFDLEKILGKKCWIQYQALAKIQIIEQLLPKQKDLKSILIKEDKGMAHWVAITRNEYEYEFFNSYGQDTGKTMSYVNNPSHLNENSNKLIELLKNKKYN